MKKKLYLLDGMALAYRAHFAFIRSQLKNSEGIPTGPILGFANTLVHLLDEEKPDYMAVVWDTHEPTFRHKMDPEYKVNRPPQPDELRTGIPLIKEMVTNFGIPNLEQHGYEADDIIGTLAMQAEQSEVETYLVTPDKDFMQLVREDIFMIKPDNQNGGFNLIDREGVYDYFGVYPEKVIDVLAIIGDTSDNIPGVPGVGKKGAPKLIQKYGSLESAIEAAPTMSAKRQREGLTNYKDQALHAKEMVTIKTDVPDTVHWQSLTWTGPDKRTLGAFFKRMEFRTLTKRYLGEEGQADLFSGGGESSEAVLSVHKRLDQDDVAYHTVIHSDELEELVERWRTKTVLCIDTETDSPDSMQARLVGISIAHDEGEAWYLPVNVEGAPAQEEVLSRLQPLVGEDKVCWVAHNMKYDRMVLSRSGLELGERCFDTMIAAYLLDASQRLKMDELAKRYLSYEPIPIEELIGKRGKGQKTMAEIPFAEVAPYACEDADITLRLYRILRSSLEEEGLLDIAMNLDFPLVAVLSRMEQYGVKVDRNRLEEFSRELAADLGAAEEAIYRLTDVEFNINSPKQLGEILFEKLGLPAKKKTRTGQYSTAEPVLQQLAAEHEVVEKILDFRSLGKLKSTYADALPKLIHEETGRIHTSYHQAVAATGRLSSSDPNLQNIPIRTERGREIRRSFIAEEGYSILAADYSQIELRIIASISGDEQMIHAFRRGEDIHARTAMEIFALNSLDEVNPDQRRKAKEVNFGIPYGVSAYGLASRLDISNKEGQEMIDRFFERFPGIQTYIDETLEFARNKGYVETLLGRRREIPDIHSKNFNARSFAERSAINMPIQGTAADIIKRAMIRIDQDLRASDRRTRMVMQVHDELVFELHKEELDLVSLIVERMEGAMDLSVPLTVETGVADDWFEAH
ncbi:MAG: DNA polymerase I [Balneolaceae bacterium]